MKNEKWNDAQKAWEKYKDLQDTADQSEKRYKEAQLAADMAEAEYKAAQEDACDKKSKSKILNT